MERSVTVKDIASELNISLSTVHKALTGKKGVGDKRREEVLRVAREMGYEVNSVAQSLARKGMNIGVIMPSSSETRFEDMKRGMNEESERLEKYRVQVFYYKVGDDITQGNAEKLCAWLEEKEIDAIVYCPSPYVSVHEFLPIMRNVKVPIFSAGEECYDINSVADITVNNYTDGQLAADFLQCIEGEALRAAVFCTSMERKDDKEKVSTFIGRVEKAGGKVVYLCETENDVERIQQCMEQLLKTEANAIYINSEGVLSICQYIEKHDLKKRYSVVCSGISENVKAYMKKGIVKAVVGRRQDEVGKTAVRKAYEYLVAQNSYKRKIVARMIKHSNTGYYVDFSATDSSVEPVAGMKIGVQGVLSDGTNKVEFLPATFEYDGNGEWTLVSREPITHNREQEEAVKVTVSWNTNRKDKCLFMITDKADAIDKLKEPLMKWISGGVYIDGKKTSEMKTVIWIHPQILLLADVE